MPPNVRLTCAAARALAGFVYNLPLAFQEPLRLVEGGIPFTDKLSGGLSQPQRNADGDSQAHGLSAGVIFVSLARAFGAFASC